MTFLKRCAVNWLDKFDTVSNCKYLRIRCITSAYESGFDLFSILSILLQILYQQSTGIQTKTKRFCSNLFELYNICVMEKYAAPERKIIVHLERKIYVTWGKNELLCRPSRN